MASKLSARRQTHNIHSVCTHTCRFKRCEHADTAWGHRHKQTGTALLSLWKEQSGLRGEESGEVGKEGGGESRYLGDGHSYKQSFCCRFLRGKYTMTGITWQLTKQSGLFVGEGEKWRQEFVAAESLIKAQTCKSRWLAGVETGCLIRNTKKTHAIPQQCDTYDTRLMI